VRCSHEQLIDSGASVMDAAEAAHYVPSCAIGSLRREDWKDLERELGTDNLDTFLRSSCTTGLYRRWRVPGSSASLAAGTDYDDLSARSTICS
jgi:hypothetical protein